MGGGGSKSESVKTTNITTETTTNIRDIGLTGQHAIDMAAILEAGSIDRTAITAGLMDKLIQETGSAWNKLIGGAGDYAEDLVMASGAAGSQLAQVQAAAIPQLVTAWGEAKEGQIEKIMPWVALSVVGLFVVMKMGRKK